MSTSPTPAAASAKRLEGKVAIITGGASGIGERTACLFCEHGAKVVIADVQDEPGRAVCRRLGRNAAFFHCDVTAEDDVRRVVDATVAAHGKLDIMFNNAGVIDAAFGSVLTTEKSEMERVLGVNLVGSFLGAKHAARVMIPAGKGCILFTASACASIAGLGTLAYASSKHGIVGVVRNLAAELGQHGIRVNCVSPYGLATNMGRSAAKEAGGFDPALAETVLSEAGNLKGAVMNVDDVAQAALFLASDEARYVSGVNLTVDGGFSVVNPSLSTVFSGLSNL
ncbi:hypothetical protein ACLOJK_020812 [Asimina triloba]